MPLSKPVILVIDDNSLVRDSTVAMLQAMNYDAQTAVDGPSGLLRLEEQHFDMVICDQGLPGMDGLTVLRTIKSRWPELPVVMISGWSLPKLEDEIRPDGFLEKPFKIGDLNHIVETNLKPADAAGLS